jgi:YebC/PmpR family DNA-binding regulatory protein
MGKQWKKGFKAEMASKRGAIFTKFVKEIQVAAKLGGIEPDTNIRLRLAIDSAKAASCPKDTIEKAIKRGAGLLDDGKDIEELLYEGYAPYQVGVLVECQTDNRARTAPELRLLFTKAGGNMGELGSVAWMFDRLGLIEAVRNNPVDIEEEAIEAGANDVELNEKTELTTEASFYTAPEELGLVRDQLTARGWSIKVAELSYKSKTITDLTEEQKNEVYEFLNKLEDHGDSHRVYASI